jgi:uncharacterized membrane protein
MSNLVVFGFDGIHTADEVLNTLRSLQKDYLIDLEGPRNAVRRNCASCVALIHRQGLSLARLATNVY